MVSNMGRMKQNAVVLGRSLLLKPSSLIRFRGCLGATVLKNTRKERRAKESTSAGVQGVERSSVD